ncbi:unnamed protein product [Zymoseptoria tritici ST99CH_3D1]|nr:unnamed protein product [Zymoseptoria tritici ST99CH_3D1]
MVPHHHYQEIARSILTPLVVKYQITNQIHHTIKNTDSSFLPSLLSSTPVLRLPAFLDLAVSLHQFTTTRPACQIRIPTLQSAFTRPNHFGASTPQHALHHPHRRHHHLGRRKRGKMHSTRRVVLQRIQENCGQAAMTSGSAEFRRNHTASPLEVTGYCDDIGVCQVDQ